MGPGRKWTFENLSGIINFQRQRAKLSLTICQQSHAILARCTQLEYCMLLDWFTRTTYVPSLAYVVSTRTKQTQAHTEGKKKRVPLRLPLCLCVWLYVPRVWTGPLMQAWRSADWKSWAYYRNVTTLRLRVHHFLFMVLMRVTVLGSQAWCLARLQSDVDDAHDWGQNRMQNSWDTHGANTRSHQLSTNNIVMNVEFGRSGAFCES